jgi:hypothetical protein
VRSGDPILFLADTRTRLVHTVDRRNEFLSRLHDDHSSQTVTDSVFLSAFSYCEDQSAAAKCLPRRFPSTERADDRDLGEDIMLGANGRGSIGTFTNATRTYRIAWNSHRRRFDVTLNGCIVGHHNREDGGIAVAVSLAGSDRRDRLSAAVVRIDDNGRVKVIVLPPA